MAFFRTLSAATLAAVLMAAGGGFALADPPPWAHGHGHHGNGNDGQGNNEQGGAPRSHGVVTGTIAGVDYATGSIIVATPNGPVPVAVTPTTSIFHGSAFASFSDLGRGARVSIDVTDVGGRLIAQIIRVR